MNRAAIWVLLLTTLAAVPAAAETEVEKFSAELDALVSRHEYTRAEHLVRQRLESRADAAVTNFQIGKAYFDHDEWQRSAGFLEESLKFRSSNDEAHRLLGLAYCALHRPDDAEAQLLEASKENPTNKVNAYFAGHQLLLNGKFEAALPYLYSALSWKPLESQALEALALAQVRLGNYGLAESYYRKAIGSAQTSDDGHFTALVNLGVLLLLGHDPARLEEGLGCAQRAENLQPNSAAAHFLAGKALFKLGRLREAGPELAQAAKLNPEDGKPHFLLALLYDQLGQHDLAQKERQDVARLQGRPGQPGMAAADPLPIAPK
jgi:tetratricopeptide (TPR) repeat protein